MPVEAACPSCDGKFRLPDAAAGKKIRCPKCKGPLDVPPLAAAEAATAETAAPQAVKPTTVPEPANAASSPPAPLPPEVSLPPATPLPPAMSLAPSVPAGKTVEATCPSCAGKFRLPEAAAGKKIRCPKCKGPVEVPAIDAPVSPPAAVTPTVGEGLKSAWRTASQEPAPAEMLRTPTATSPAATVKPQPEKTRVEKAKPEQSRPEKPVSEKRAVENPAAVAATIDIPKKPAAVPTTKPTPVEITVPTPPANKHKFVAPEPTTPQWFFRGEDGVAFGPVDRPTLDAWKAEGRISVDCQVLQQGSDQWQWASDLYPELEEAEEEVPVATPAAVEENSSKGSTKSSSIHTVANEEEHEEESLTNEARLSPHSKPVAFLLALTLGWLGIHRFYLGYVGLGLAMLFTLGGLMMWSLTDALRILFGHVPDSEGLKLRD
ncbi:NINE protein [Anatilimnocola sp. NA78]|uniref:NINE protein n=1 Tax=Anatilimnocola sp. NA78 TaxID=3415683 RepID=UPI003CE5A478